MSQRAAKAGERSSSIFHAATTRRGKSGRSQHAAQTRQHAAGLGACHIHCHDKKIEEQLCIYGTSPGACRNSQGGGETSFLRNIPTGVSCSDGRAGEVCLSTSALGLFTRSTPGLGLPRYHGALWVRVRSEDMPGAACRDARHSIAAGSRVGARLSDQGHGGPTPERPAGRRAVPAKCERAQGKPG